MSPEEYKRAGERIALNAAMLRLFKGCYGYSGRRHSDALFVKEGLELAQEEIAQLTEALACARTAAEQAQRDAERLDWLEASRASGFQWAVRESPLHARTVSGIAGGCYQLIQFTKDKSLQPTLRLAIDAARSAAAPAADKKPAAQEEREKL